MAPQTSGRGNDLATAFDERAGVLEHDEGLPRPEAERLAREQLAASAYSAELARQHAEVERYTPRPLRPARAEEPAQSWRTATPEAGPGVTIRLPAVEVSGAEYDAHLDALIAAVPPGSAEAQRLAYTKRKGWVVPRGQGTIFTRGRW